MKKYYKSIGKFIGKNSNNLYQIQTNDEIIEMPDFLYYFWNEFNEVVEIQKARSDIINSYEINDEIFDEMIEALVMDGLILVQIK